ncbi:MAG: hypothetical protein KAJ19_23700, partial [Gammaproteobacteria bacterium]|nr:hypothetical protein [Gammaproteobacteria bacterium]
MVIRIIINSRAVILKHLGRVGFLELTLESRYILYNSEIGDILFPTPRPLTGLKWLLRVKSLKKRGAYLDGDENMNIEKIIQHGDTGKKGASLIDA